MSVPGFVTLVGAGPGDPTLLTIAGRRALERCDSVIYDKLVDPRLLEIAPAEAERLYVGKEHASEGSAEAGDGRQSLCASQDAINSLLIRQAQAGRRVVRLKGGDPLLFARGAEEAEALRRAGVEFAIIPGVTAALGCAASAGIPLTHRSAASAVAFVTAHEDPHKDSSLDWGHLARFPGTVVLYMARTRGAAIARALLEGGRPAATPIAWIEWGATNRQKVHVDTLAQAGDHGPPRGFRSPVLAIIGEVCRFREAIDWFERRPFFGQTVLIPRPPERSAETASLFEELGARTIIEPTLRLDPPEDWAPVDRVLAELDRIDWLAFTSRPGVERFLSRLLESGRDLRSLGGVRLAAIGPSTAQALEDYRLRADFVPTTYRSEDLAEGLRSRVSGQRIVLVRADRGRAVLREELEKHADTQTVVVYRQRDVEKPSPETARAILHGEVDWVLLTSGNIARGFLGWLDEQTALVVRERTKLVSISPVTSEVVRAEGFDVAVEAKEFTLAGMVDAMTRARRSEIHPGLDALPEQQTGSE